MEINCGCANFAMVHNSLVSYAGGETAVLVSAVVSLLTQEYLKLLINQSPKMRGDEQNKPTDADGDEDEGDNDEGDEEENGIPADKNGSKDVPEENGEAPENNEEEEDFEGNPNEDEDDDDDDDNDGDDEDDDGDDDENGGNDEDDDDEDEDEEDEEEEEEEEDLQPPKKRKK